MSAEGQTDIHSDAIVFTFYGILKGVSASMTTFQSEKVPQILVDPLFVSWRSLCFALDLLTLSLG